MLRSILALGLVAGITAVVTDASWTSTQTATASFGASSFVVQSSQTGTFPAGDPTPSTTAAMLFSTGAQTMSPGAEVVAPLALRVYTGSIGGSVVIAAPTTALSAACAANALCSALQYRVYQQPTNAGCVEPGGTPLATAVAGASWIVGADGSWITGLAAGLPSAGVNLAAASATLPGTPSYLCWLIQLPTTAPAALQGSTLSSTTYYWNLTATSSS